MPDVPITVTNSGPDSVNNVTVHGVGVYSVPSSSCATLASGQSCTATIQFCPSTSGTYTNELVVTATDSSTNASLQATTTLQGSAS